MGQREVGGCQMVQTAWLHLRVAFIDSGVGHFSPPLHRMDLENVFQLCRAPFLAKNFFLSPHGPFFNREPSLLKAC